MWGLLLPEEVDAEKAEAVVSWELLLEGVCDEVLWLLFWSRKSRSRSVANVRGEATEASWYGRGMDLKGDAEIASAPPDGRELLVIVRSV